MHHVLTIARRVTLGAMAQTLYLSDLSFSTRSDNDPVPRVSPILRVAAQSH